MERARKTNPYGFLIKPFSERELHATIQMALKRHSVEIALTESRQLLQQALDAAGMGTVEFDCDASRLRLSPASASLIGQPKSCAVSFADFLSAVNESDRPTMAGRMNDCNAPTSKFSEEFRVRHLGEAEHWIKIDASPLPGRRLSGILQNITERKHAELHLSMLNDSLEEEVSERTNELQQTLRELEAFTYSAAHDLRAPIRAILGLSHAMEEEYADVLDDTGRQLLTTIGSSALKMADLLNALLEMARTSHSPMNLANVDVSKIAQEQISTLLDANPARRAEVHVAPEMKAWGDPALLRCLIDNLVRNAWKFSSKKATTFIDVSCSEQNGSSVFLVRDKGCGFDVKFAERLFEPFKRLHNQTEFSGSGIGLSIVKRIISRHGGRIWAQSVPGEGSTFCFTLPRTHHVRAADII